MINSRVHWYVVCYSGEKHTAAPLLGALSLHYHDEDLFWPLQMTKDKGRISQKPVLPRYVFVRTTFDKLKQVFSQPDVRTYGYPLKRIGATANDDYQWATDNDIERFRWFLENMSGSLFLMHKSYYELHDKTKVRVKSGILQGMEGVVCRYQGDRRFAFNIGGFAVMVTDVMKWDMEVVGDNVRMTDAYSVHNEIDLLQESLKMCRNENGELTYTDSSDKLLSSLVLWHLAENDKPTGKQKNTRFSWNKDSFDNAAELQSVLSKLSNEDSQRLKIISLYVEANYPSRLHSDTLPDLSDLFHPTELRPFLTMSGTGKDTDDVVVKHKRFVEIVRRVMLPEDEVSFVCGVHNFYTTEYFAHIALFRQEGGVMAITNWSTCASSCIDKARDEGCRLPLVVGVVNETDNQKVMFREVEGIKGTSVFIPGVDFDLNQSVAHLTAKLVPAVRAAVSMLTEQSIALCKEIWACTYPALRQELQKVWVKAIHTDVDSCPLHAETSQIAELLKEYVTSSLKERDCSDFCCIDFANYLLATLVDTRFQSSRLSYRLITKTDAFSIKCAVSEASQKKLLPPITGWHKIPSSSVEECVFEGQVE